MDEWLSFFDCNFSFCKIIFLVNIGQYLDAHFRMKPFSFITVAFYILKMQHKLSTAKYKDRVTRPGVEQVKFCRSNVDGYTPYTHLVLVGRT